MKKIYWKYSLGATCLAFIGLGIGFSYPPLLPALTEYNWLSTKEANSLPTYVFTGYLISIVIGPFIFFKINNKTSVIRISAIILSLCLLLSAINLGYIWISILALVFGSQAGTIALILPALVLSNIPHKYKGLVSGFLTAGASFGFIISGIIVPCTSPHSLHITWILLFSFAAIAIIVSWNTLPKPRYETVHSESKSEKDLKITYLPLMLIIISYFLYSVAYLGLAVYINIFIADIFELSESIRGVSWILLGLGSFTGAIGAGYISSKIGIKVSLLCSLLLIMLTNGIIYYVHSEFVIYVCTFFGGIGIYAGFAMYSALYAIHYCKGKIVYKAWWFVTIANAVAQVLGTIFMNSMISFLSIKYLFIMCAFIMLAGIVVIIFCPGRNKDLLDII